MRLRVLYCVWILCDKKIHEVKVSFQGCQVVRFSSKVDPFIIMESDFEFTKVPKESLGFFCKTKKFQYQLEFIFKTKWILIDLIDSQVQLDCCGNKKELDIEETSADVGIVWRRRNYTCLWLWFRMMIFKIQLVVFFVIVWTNCHSPNVLRWRLNLHQYVNT